MTVNDNQCQFWSSMYPYNHTYEDDARFPMDVSVKAAKNFCRDPTNKGRPWCYTVDPEVVWEYCSFRPCTSLIILYDFLVTVKAAPHECLIRAGQT